MNINWYPGHMAKARRTLENQIRNTDLLIELCDARLPYSSRNPDLNRMAGGKKRLLFMNKADLADPGLNRQWERYFSSTGTETYLIQATRMKSKEVLSIVDSCAQQAVEKAAARGYRKTVRAMVAGVPNVGKSTFINQLRGGNVADTGDRPGVTRNSQWIKVTPYLELLDTPGLLWPRLDDQQAAKRLSYLGTIRDEILDLNELALSLADDLAERVPDRLSERFHIHDISLRGVELLEEMCRGRGFLLKGNEVDYDRCCRVILDEFRCGKLGRITLESPEGSMIHAEN